MSLFPSGATDVQFASGYALDLGDADDPGFAAVVTVAGVAGDGWSPATRSAAVQGWV